MYSSGGGGHRSQNNADLAIPFNGTTKIIPANNTNLECDLPVQLLQQRTERDAESNLNIWNSADTIHWNNQGYTSGDPNPELHGKQNLKLTTRWTLSDANNPLPVTFTSF